VCNIAIVLLIVVLLEVVPRVWISHGPGACYPVYGTHAYEHLELIRSPTTSESPLAACGLQQALHGVYYSRNSIDQSIAPTAHWHTTSTTIQQSSVTTMATSQDNTMATSHDNTTGSDDDGIEVPIAP
jgi:hypothetical protein